MNDWVENLPVINATCNAAGAICVVCGWRAVRSGKINCHRNFMVAGTFFLAIFLLGYVTRISFAGVTRFQHQGLLRTIYFALLTSHITLAIVCLPLIVTSLRLGFKKRIAEHRFWARLTLPLWLYVATTGVIVYFMLYQL